ncbi:D-alanyl-D-alanine carboxypeptidase [Pelagirhabdus alkalitolerans]|uniref:D-alanyl-D-alanine carboxypeptidase n=1 Tax=Pelagirhabdus alkalitolerans TaxID=1612202 RepID=A0A1G6HBJ6_9BACI|nr:D-alanyl-D-alanine carboxypeptidase family protein [Pelagirhabdus alkalitolerans]SDB91659.1 D-alanyl-D-alanine carboxypeptidase [Pelagirhabdus alkalitolerans]
MDKLKFAYILIVLSLLISPMRAFSMPSISAQQAAVYHVSKGEFIYEKNTNTPQLIASITKIMTAIIAIEHGDLDDVVTISEQATLVEGSSLYLQPGEEIKLRDLIYGLLLRSGNDAAIAIAEHIGGSEEGFITLMNEKLVWLGLEDTHFENPHGLDGTNHLSTASDVAKIMAYGLNHTPFIEMIGAQTFKSDNRDYAWINKNKLLNYYQPYIVGGKTGYTRAAGRTLVTAAQKDDHTLIVVTLNDGNDWQNHIRLYNWGFKQIEHEVNTFRQQETTLKDDNSWWNTCINLFKQITGVQI